jgi:hypothetical protein
MMQLYQGRVQWQALVNTVMKLLVSGKAANFSSTLRISRKTLLYVVVVDPD